MADETIRYRNQEFQASPEVDLLSALREQGLSPSAPCGVRGICAKCTVIARGDLTEPDDVERAYLSASELERGMRLSCRAFPRGNVVVEWISGEEGAGQVLEHSLNFDVDLDPEVVAEFVPMGPRADTALRERTGGDKASLLGKLSASVGFDLRAELPVLASLPDKLAQGRRHGGLVAWLQREQQDSKGHVQRKPAAQLIGIETPESHQQTDASPSIQNFGVAVDIGSTTIVGFLWDLQEGNVVAIASTMNGQIPYGDDIISRMSFANERDDGLQILNRAVIESVNEVLTALYRKTRVSRKHVRQLTFVGNSVMQHLFLAIPPRYLAVHPFAPASLGPVRFRPAELGLRVHPDAVGYFGPNMGSYVGSDIAAASLAAGIGEDERLKLLIDLGTNGEMVLGNRERIIACSTATGPAFEGGRLRQGMRAAPGAISHVGVHRRILYEVVGGGTARGFCGSGVIDALTVLLELGAIDLSGRLKPDNQLPMLLMGRVEGSGPERRVIFATADETGGAPVGLTQQDIRELQLAIGAVAAGARVLMKEFGVGPEDLDEVVLAGGFGNYVTPHSAMRTGLVPTVDPRRLVVGGNAAGAGAQLALASRTARRRLEQLAEKSEHVSLATRQDFQDEFVRALTFPGDE